MCYPVSMRDPRPKSVDSTSQPDESAAAPLSVPAHGRSRESGHWDDSGSHRDGGHPGESVPGHPPVRRRRKLVPLILFLLTCVSTFWVGITDWQPLYEFGNLFARGPGLLGVVLDLTTVRQLIVRNWDQGLIYMACVLAILLVHEMGHFVATLIYRIPATVPIFLPFPFNPIGTLGAVIGMEGMQADRRQIFDIGIAGPLAGLVVAIPLAIVGIYQLDLTTSPGGQLAFECPLLFQWMLAALQVPGYEQAIEKGVWLSQLNPCFAAAWGGIRGHRFEHGADRAAGWRTYHARPVWQTRPRRGQGDYRAGDCVHGLPGHSTPGDHGHFCCW